MMEHAILNATPENVDLMERIVRRSLRILICRHREAMIRNHQLHAFQIDSISKYNH